MRFRWLYLQDSDELLSYVFYRMVCYLHQISDKIYQSGGPER